MTNGFIVLAVFGQTFETHDLAIIALLVLLEGVLSIDNALVLGLLAKPLPPKLRAKALTYGLIGAFVFRIAAIGAASFLLRWTIAKLLGGLYLVYVALKHFYDAWKNSRPVPTADSESAVLHSAEIAAAHATSSHSMNFWWVVAVIELTDIAFAVDSILAAIALVSGHGPAVTGTHPKMWVVVTGGMLGVILMRFAAAIFIRLLEKFPRFETSAYLLVIVIGVKLLADWAFNRDPHPNALNFHSPAEAEFWVFWILMLVCFAVGFIPAKGKSKYTNEMIVPQSES